jgi:hypothetical protein
VLRSDGTVSDNVAGSNPDDDRTPQKLLQDDGIQVVNGKADPTREIVADELSDRSAALD